MGEALEMYPSLRLSDPTAIAKIFVYAAEEVGANRRQSIRTAMYSAAKRLGIEYDVNYEQWLHGAFTLILQIYGREIHESFLYRGGFGKGFWLSIGQKAHMQDALLYAYEWCVTELSAHRDDFFEPRHCDWCGRLLLPSEGSHCAECLEGSCD